MHLPVNLEKIYLSNSKESPTMRLSHFANKLWRFKSSDWQSLENNVQRIRLLGALYEFIVARDAALYAPAFVTTWSFLMSLSSGARWI